MQRLLSVAEVVERMRPLLHDEHVGRAPTRASTWRAKSRHSAGSWDSDAMDFKDYYQTLGLSKTATDKEIKSTYRKLARKHHPDVNPGDKAAEAKFKEINEAYEVLGDPDEAEEVRRAGRQLADVRAGRRAPAAPASITAAGR